MVSRNESTLRKQALEILEHSTKMLEVATHLLEQGNRTEANRLWKDARKERTISTLLLAEANTLKDSDLYRRHRPTHSPHFHNSLATH
jgi:hypothetical protein